MVLTVPGSRSNDDGDTSTGAAVAGVVLAVDPASSQAPFRQLRGQIVDAVESGALPPGTRLPTVRAFAEQVGIAARTAAKVYRELESTGVLETRGRSGTFVAERDASAAALLRAAEEYAEKATTAGFTVDDAVAAIRGAFTRRG